MDILSRLFGARCNASYTSLNRCKHDARSSSKFTYRTLPCAQLNPNHGLPSARDMHNWISANDLPALDGPAINILWPSRRIPSIKLGASSGILSQSASKSSGSGKSSLTVAIHSSHSLNDSLPIFVAIKN